MAKPHLESPLIGEWLVAARHVVSLGTVPGFVRAYEANLAKGMSKGDAYEATEAEHELYYQRRKYLDRDTFMPALCRYYREQKKTPATAGACLRERRKIAA